MYDYFLYNFSRNSDVVFGNKGLDDSMTNLKRFKEAHELLPEFLRFENKKRHQ